MFVEFSFNCDGEVLTGDSRFIGICLSPLLVLFGDSPVSNLSFRFLIFSALLDEFDDEDLLPFLLENGRHSHEIDPNKK
jgi:hypothetical protein